MSELAVNTIENVAGTAPPAVTRGEFVQARINFNGSGTVAIRDSAGVASLTDNGVGDYSVNFSTAFGNANYFAVAAGGTPGTSIAAAAVPPGASGNKTASVGRVGLYNTVPTLGSGVDHTHVDAIYVGNYA